MEKRYKLRLRVHKVGKPMYIGSSGRWHLSTGTLWTCSFISLWRVPCVLSRGKSIQAFIFPDSLPLQLRVGSLNFQAWTELLKVIPVEQRWLPKIAVAHRCRLHFLRYFVEQTKVGAITRIY